MENIIFYFSGTGNSLMVAKTLVKELGTGEVKYHRRHSWGGLH
jgi:flavodoxin